MFKAIRDFFAGLGRRLGGGLRTVRPSDVARLFAFEFTVVLLGVLAAQALASWLTSRGTAARSEEALTEYRRDLADGHETALIWSAAIPCLRQRVSAVMITAGNAGIASPEMVKRPGLWTTLVDPLDVDTRLYAQRVFGPDWLQKTGDAAKQINRIDTLSEELAGRWMQFTRLDPANGRVRDGDLLAAREAAATIQSHLRSIEISAYLTEVGLRELRIVESHSIEDGTRRRPARTCDEIVRDREIAVHDSV